METTEELATVRLARGDAAAAFELSAEAGWNQTVLDWQLMLDDGEAIGQRSVDGRLVASALLLPYGERLAWIAMVLTSDGVPPPRPRHRQPAVDPRALPRPRPDRRPRRHARRQRGLPAARLRGGLRPAAPARRARAGHPAVARRGRDPPAAGGARPRCDRAGSMPACSASTAAACSTTCAATSRSARCSPRARAGSRASSWRAPAAARCTSARWSRRARWSRACCSSQALVDADGPVSIDVPDAQSGFLEMLQEAGFAPLRPFTRMLQGPPAALGDMATCFAIAGPEFG